MGTLQGVKMIIHIRPNAHPSFFRSRPVPYALRAKVETDLDQLQKQGVIEPVQFSERATPHLTCSKTGWFSSALPRLQADSESSSYPDTFPLPKIDDLFSTLSGGTTFTKLDLEHAYQQLVLDDNSQKLVTINTLRGLIRYHHLPFGVSAATLIFQRTMESLLQGIPHVCVYLDDALITGRSHLKHLRNLEVVLQRLQTAAM